MSAVTYTAYNCALATTTGTIAGTSYATGAKCAIQLSTSTTCVIRIVEYGVSFNGSAAATPAVVELSLAGAASTMSTTHSTSTILPNMLGGQSSRLTMGTGNTGFGNGAITTNTTSQTFDAQFVAPTNQYIKTWTLDTYPEVTVSKFLQLRINTSATVTAFAWIS
jgi:hypothetical protein